MDDCDRSVLARLPLAEAVLRIWQWVASEGFLGTVFDKHRGRSYQRILSFGVIVWLMSDALLRYAGSGRQCFEHAAIDGVLETSIQAVFGKLRRLPIALSMGFLADCTVRLMQLFPDITVVVLPASLKPFEVMVLDGKAIKRVAKRLKPLRNAKGGLLGGRALVALRLRFGIVTAMYAHPDGQANDVRFVPDLVPQVRQLVPGTRLFMGDRQFCIPAHMALYTDGGDHFLIRHHKNVPFSADPSRPSRQTVDGQGRPVREEWGWLGRPKHKQRRYVRFITLQRPGSEPIQLVTDLLDADGYPATDLLWLYLQRWTIERVFQQVTEVFGLQGLIGSSPEATIFQFAFCLVLYNIIQVMRAYAAQAGERALPEVSTEKLFGDIQRDLNAWNEVVGPAKTIDGLPPLDLIATRNRLFDLLRQAWSKVWLKSKTYARKPRPHTSAKRCHGSVHRILENKPGKSRRRRGSTRLPDS